MIINNEQLEIVEDSLVEWNDDLLRLKEEQVHLDNARELLDKRIKTIECVKGVLERDIKMFKAKKRGKAN